LIPLDTFIYENTSILN